MEPDTKIRERTEGATVDRMKYGDSSSARIDDGSTGLNSFSMIAEPLLKAPEKCIGDALVNKDAEAPKSNLPSMEVRMLSFVAGGLLPTGTASTAIRAIFPHRLLLGPSVTRPRRTRGTNFNKLAPLLLKEDHRTTRSLISGRAAPVASWGGSIGRCDDI